MNLKILNIDKINEIVRIEVIGNCDLGFYMLADTTYFPNHKISNELRHLYWFPDQSVKKGDYIRLYTKKGAKRNYLNNSNTTTYEYYWGLGGKVWNNNGDGAVLFEINKWKTTRVP